MVGSLGTLGLVAEAILRTNPIPPVSRWFTGPCTNPMDATTAVLAPSAVLWDGSQVWVQLEGHGPDVAAQHADLLRAVPVTEVDGPPSLPDHRWSLSPSEVLTLGPDSPHDTGGFVATVGLGVVFAERPAPSRPLTPAVAEITRRLKDNFDPTHRLNPGRSVAVG